MWILLLLAGAAAWYAFRRTETHGGVVHFTMSGRKAVMGELAKDSVIPSAVPVPGANLTLTVQGSSPGAAGVTAAQAVATAEQSGGVVCLSANYDGANPALLVVCSKGQEKTVAAEGNPNGLAVLTIVSG